MKPKHVYLILAVIGLIGPYCFFVSFLLVGRPSAAGFVHQLFGAPISAFFAADLIVSAVVFVGYLRREGKRCHIGAGWLWLCLAILLSVGLSCAFPFFLYVRESYLEKDQAVS